MRRCENCEQFFLWAFAEQYCDAYAEAYEVDLIVMGSHGASGLNEWLIGSNAQKIVRLAHCPVLTIKNKSG